VLSWNANVSSSKIKPHCSSPPEAACMSRSQSTHRRQTKTCSALWFPDLALGDVKKAYWRQVSPAQSRTSNLQRTLYCTLNSSLPQSQWGVSWDKAPLWNALALTLSSFSSNPIVIPHRHIQELLYYKTI
jgi:hypothetical protein